MQKCPSEGTVRRERGIARHGIDREANQPGAAGSYHPRQQSDEHRRTECELRRKGEGFLIVAGGNGADSVIQNTLFPPSRG